MHKLFAGICLAMVAWVAQAQVTSTGTPTLAPFSLVLASCDVTSCSKIKIDNTGHLTLTGGKLVDNYLTTVEIGRLGTIVAKLQNSFDANNQTCHSQSTPRPATIAGAALYSVFAPALILTNNPNTSSATTINIISFNSSSSSFTEYFCDGNDFELTMQLNVYANYLLGKYGS